MTVLLYIFAAIGAVVTICGIIALGFDISQTRDDMTYYLHTRFPELEKEIAEKLAAFEAKLNNEGFVHKDQYDEDWNQFDYRLNTISDNMYELDKRLDVVADDNGGLWNKLEELQMEIEKRLYRVGEDDERIWNKLKEHEENFVTKNDYARQINQIIDRLDGFQTEIERMKKNADFNIKGIYERLEAIETDQTKWRIGVDYACNAIPKPEYDPKDVTFDIKVGDDPEQMSRGTTI